MLALFTGCLGGVMIGATAQRCTADHRYIRALAERHEAEASYYINKLNEQIQENKGDIARERKKDGSKTN